MRARGGIAAPAARMERVGRGPQGDVAPCGPLCISGEVAASRAALRATAARFRAAGSGRGSRAGTEDALRAVPLVGPISVLRR